MSDNATIWINEYNTMMITLDLEDFFKIMNGKAVSIAVDTTERKKEQGK